MPLTRALRRCIPLPALLVPQVVGCAAEPDHHGDRLAEQAPTAAADLAPLRSAFPDHAARVLDVGEGLRTTRDGFVVETPSVAPGGVVDVRLPRDGAGAVRLRAPGGFELHVRESGVTGEGRLAARSVAYARAGGTAYWTVASGVPEEWLHLGADAVRRGEPVAAWELDGGTPRKVADLVEIDDSQGVPRLRVTAPSAYAAGGRSIATHLAVRGSRVELSVDADHEAVLVDPVWSATTSMGKAREYGPTATLLSSGKVLVAGGGNDASAEVYDPATATWSATGGMGVQRNSHTATLLANGEALVAGSMNWFTTTSGQTLATAELFDPNAGTWSSAASMVHFRADHTATLLDSGRVLVAGNFGAAGNSVEVYDLARNAWLPGSPMVQGRWSHAAAPLADGERVLVVGGSQGASAELLTPLQQGETCTNAGDCVSGFCVDGVCCDTACDAGACDACSAAQGADTDGTCKLLTGTACNDGDACTRTDTCQAGVCTGSSPVICTASDQCHTAGTCNPATGACSTPAKPDDTACNDGDACTQTDSCQAGVCAGSNPVVCAPPGECQDALACDVVAGCQYGPKQAGTACGAAASCVNGKAVPQAACDGSSSACPAAAPIDCGDFVCANGACKTTCAGPSDCAANAYCGGGQCKPKASRGGACTTTSECASGPCVDGFCCDTTCTGQCEACDVSGHEGACSPVTGAPHGGRAACATDGSSCGGSCNGTKTEGCAFPTTKCRDASCDEPTNVATLEAQCDGQGSCPAVQKVACAPFLCGATACNGDCQKDDDCAGEAFCGADVCVPKLADGTACAASHQCTSGFCVDGVCCESACEGQCEACGEPGSEGSCVAVDGAPRGDRDGCAGSGSCAGACDGVATDACTFPDTTTSCGAGSCEDGTAIGTSFCDGAGACATGQSVTCAPYGCDAEACKTSCAGGEDCVEGYVCEGSACVLATDGDAGADAAVDAGTDAGERPEDAGDDAGDDADDDAGDDAAFDAAPDAASSDGSSGDDAGAPDGSHDAAADAVPDAPSEATGDAASDAPSDGVAHPGEIVTDDLGCGCRAAGSATSPIAWWWSALPLAAVVARRRRGGREESLLVGRAPREPQVAPHRALDLR